MAKHLLRGACQGMPCLGMIGSRLHSTQQLNGLACVVKAKATAAAEAAGRPPPSERLLSSACRAAVEAQMQLAVIEQQLAQVERFAGDAQSHYMEIMMLVRLMVKVCSASVVLQMVAASGTFVDMSRQPHSFALICCLGAALWALGSPQLHQLTIQLDACSRRPWSLSCTAAAQLRAPHSTSRVQRRSWRP